MAGGEMRFEPLDHDRDHDREALATTSSTSGAPASHGPAMALGGHRIGSDISEPPDVDQ